MISSSWWLLVSMVAVIGLMESSAVNIVAAMLISPLMVSDMRCLPACLPACLTSIRPSISHWQGPVMALTFGTAISDRQLQWVGVKGMFAGAAISLVFGFIFGLLVGTTGHPWGYGNWPTDEMLGRWAVGKLTPPLGKKSSRFNAIFILASMQFLSTR